MAKLVNLTAHRNTMVRRRSKEMVASIRYAAGVHQRDHRGEMAGYALLSWDKSGRTHMASWEGIAALGPLPLAEYARHIIARHVTVADVNRVLGGDPPDEGA